MTPPAGMPRAGRRRLIVLRHGQTVHNAEGVWQGQLDSELSAVGRDQAAAGARELSRYGVDAVVASDLVRAADTGQAVADACGLSLRTDRRFREIHAGSWQGMSSAQVRQQYPEQMAAMNAGEDFRRGGTGESVAHVAARVAAGARDLVASLDPGQCAVVATHGVAGRALVAELIGLPQHQAWVILGGLGNARWAELEQGSLGWRLLAWNVGASAPGGAGAAHASGSGHRA